MLTMPWWTCCCICLALFLLLSMRARSSLKKVGEHLRGFPISRRSWHHCTRVNLRVCVCVNVCVNVCVCACMHINIYVNQLGHVYNKYHMLCQIKPSLKNLTIMWKACIYSRVCVCYTCMLQTFSSGNISERHLQKSFSPSNRGLQQDKQVY